MQSSAQERGRIAVRRSGGRHLAWYRGFAIGVVLGAVLAGAGSVLLRASIKTDAEGMAQAHDADREGEGQAQGSTAGRRREAEGETAQNHCEVPSPFNELCPWYH